MKTLTKLSWQMSRVVAWGERHELLADTIVAVLMVLVLGCLLFLALDHDALWYNSLSEAERYAASGY